MRRFASAFFLIVLSVHWAIAHNSPSAHKYDDEDAYLIYNLLLPHEESYAFAEPALMIQEEAIAKGISGACLTQADASRFRGAIADYERTLKGKWLFQKRLEIAKPYKIVGQQVISALPDHSKKRRFLRSHVGRRFQPSQNPSRGLHRKLVRCVVRE
jgi:hypothetical protein